MKRYLPKQKLDMEAVEYLQTCNFADIRHDVPALLEWLQDLNWMVGDGIGDYLRPHVNEIKEDILPILLSDDDQWKYGIVICLLYTTTVKLDEAYLPVLQRMAADPVGEEKDWELDEWAEKILRKQV